MTANARTTAARLIARTKRTLWPVTPARARAVDTIFSPCVAVVFGPLVSGLVVSCMFASLRISRKSGHRFSDGDMRQHQTHAVASEQLVNVPARLNVPEVCVGQCRPPNAQISSRIGIGTPSNHSSM